MAEACARDEEGDVTEPIPAEVVNDVDNHRLVLVQGGLESELIYERRGPRLILVHTEVSKELSGRGIGGSLVEAAVRWAERDGLVIVPWCPYARHWLQENIAVSSKIQIDWDTPRESTSTHSQ
jgi:predicted GNAT family acetyltransferase